MYPAHGKLCDNFWGTTVPASLITLAASTYVGMAVEFLSPGRIFGARVYWINTNAQDMWVIIWDNTLGNIVVAKNMPLHVPTSTGWRNCWIHPTYRVTVGNIYRIAVLMGGSYRRQNTALASPVTVGPLKAWSSFQTTSANPLAASISSNTNANGVDIMFRAD
jgi:hypothetical protein